MMPAWPDRLLANTRSHDCPVCCDSAARAAKSVSSSGVLSTQSTGVRAPPAPAAKFFFCSSVAPSGNSARANTNSNNWGSGCCLAAASRSAKFRIFMGVGRSLSWLKPYAQLCAAWLAATGIHEAQDLHFTIGAELVALGLVAQRLAHGSNQRLVVQRITPQ